MKNLVTKMGPFCTNEVVIEISLHDLEHFLTDIIIHIFSLNDRSF